MKLAEGRTAKVIPSSMGSSAWLSMVMNWFLGVFEESTKTTIMSEETKNHDEEEDWLHTWKVNNNNNKKKKKKKGWTFMKKEQSKGGKTKVSDGHKVELRQTDKWAKQL